MEHCMYIFKKGVSKGNCCNNKKNTIVDDYCKKHLHERSKDRHSLKYNYDDDCEEDEFSCEEKKVLYQKWLNENEHKFEHENVISQNNNYNKPFKVINGWEIKKLIGKGGFGVVRECFKKNKKFAIKLEDISSKSLDLECQVYSNFKNKNKYIPKIYEFGFYKLKKYIVLEYLYPFKFTFDSIPKIILALKSFADKNLSHGDVKFDNMLMRNTDVVLIDLGMCSKVNSLSKNISGTLTFMSLNAHDSIITYRNDLESLMYSMLDSINKLPWDKAELDASKINKIKSMKIKFCKKLQNFDHEVIKHWKLDRNIHLYFFILYVLNLQNETKKPNYKILINNFQKKMRDALK